MRTPIDVLREEHVLILGMLDLMDRAATGEAPAAWWQEALAWLRCFADANHHGKEEGSLFPALAKVGVPVEGGPIAVMLDEHERGRVLIRSLASADAGARGALASDYVRLLRDHIDKENGVLFPLAEGVLDEGMLESVGRAFGEIEADVGPGASLAEAGQTVERLAALLAGRGRG